MHEIIYYPFKLYIIIHSYILKVNLNFLITLESYIYNLKFKLILLKNYISFKIQTSVLTAN